MPFITTPTVAEFDFLHPDPNDIYIEDIAIGLSNTPRFCGLTEPMYSVAQHAVMVSIMADDDFPGEALMHDAAEAYLSDLPSPVKLCLPRYIEIELNLLSTILNKFHLHPISSKIKEIDERMRVTEARVLGMDISGWQELRYVEPYCGLKLIPIEPHDAKELFLERFYQLQKEGKINNGKR